MHDDRMDRVLAAILANRTPGWNFPGHYLGLEYLKVSERLSVSTCPSRPEFLDAAGRLAFPALGVLSDLALASAARARMGASTRMATVTMSIFLHAAMGGEALVARSRLLSHNTSTDLLTSAAELRCGGRLQATAQASFLAMTGTSLAPVPTRGGCPILPDDLSAITLTPSEQAVMDRASAAFAPGTAGFLDRIWSGDFDRTAAGAEGRFLTGEHSGNRVGHVQGGLLFALAAAGGQAAAGDGFRIVAVHANYSRPGRSPRLRIRADLVHRGGTTACSTVAIMDEAGTILLSALIECVRADA